MGTRSIITFASNGNTLVSIYQQYDGYIENGVGHKLAEWLAEKVMVNGFTPNDMRDTTKLNGAGCLVAQFIKDFKNEIGNLYIIKPNSTGEDYNYKVDIDDTSVGNVNDLVTITVTRFDEEEPIFVGKPSELLTFKEPEDDEEPLPFS